MRALPRRQRSARLRLELSFDVDAVSSQRSINPVVREVASRHRSHVIGFLARRPSQPVHELVSKLARHDHDAGRVTDDHVTGVHDDPTGRDRIVDLSRPPVKRPDWGGAASEYREIAECADPGQVSDQSVDHETGNPSMTRLGRDEVTEDGGRHRAAGIDNYYVARLGDVKRLVDHEVVARIDLDRTSRADERQAIISEVADRRRERIQAVHHVRDLGSLECPKGCHSSHVRTLNARPDTKSGTRVHLGRLWLADHKGNAGLAIRLRQLEFNHSGSTSTGSVLSIVCENSRAMRIFDFDVAAAREHYAHQGWVHISSGIHGDFFDDLQRSVSRHLDTSKLDAFAIKGKKEQALYTFPEGTEYPGELFDVVAAVCGLNRATMTLSERHIQAYDSDADPNPQAHKDRSPSQVSVGFSVRIPSESRLVLYPYDHRAENPFNGAAELIRSLQPNEVPDIVLRGAREVVIADRPGDLVMFQGASTWHLRRRAASAVNLYVKLNDFDADPLGEDPLTAGRREQTLAYLSNGNRANLRDPMVRLSRSFDSVQRQLMRHGWRDVLQASLYSEPSFGINQLQLELLQAATEPVRLSALTAEVTGNGHSPGEVESGALTLLARGALDVLS